MLQYWIDSPLWLLSLILMVAMTATNLFSVSSFGEFEYWFAGIKVGAIVVFLTSPPLRLRVLARQIDGLQQPLGARWFLPHGFRAIFSSIVIVIFSMVGAEVATIAAAESRTRARRHQGDELGNRIA